MRNAGALVAVAVLVCVLLVASQVLVKQSVLRVGASSRGLIALLRPVSLSFTFWLAVACTAVASVLWLLLLRSAPVSTIYPLLSLSYLLMVPAARLTLGEPITPPKIVGCIVICLGVLITSRTVG